MELAPFGATTVGAYGTVAARRIAIRVISCRPKREAVSAVTGT